MLKRLTILVIAAVFAAAPALSQSRNIQVTSIASQLNNNAFKSSTGRDIPLVHIESPGTLNGFAPKARYYIQAGLHGNEKLTTQFALWLILRIKKGESPLNLLNDGQAAFDIVPTANPDGFKSNERTNIKSVNLNRNFSFLWGMSKENPGARSFSEAETLAIRALFEAHKYTAAADIHGYVNWIVAPTAPKNIVAEKTLEMYHRLTSAIQSEMGQIDATYQLKTAGGLGDGGAFEDWAFWEQNVPALCLEMVSAFREDVTYKADGSVEKSDMFLKYENFLYKVFSKTSPSNALAQQ